MTKINTLCVFCGSRDGADPDYIKAAARFGTLLGKRGIRLVYGGASIGLMGAMARAALDAGGEVIGVIPEHLRRLEVALPGVTQLITVSTMHTRKRRMFDLSDAFVVLPGGVGTLDETFEIITWRQLGLHDKPIIIADIKGYWAPFTALMNDMTGAGFIGEKLHSFYHVVTDIDAVLPAIDAARAPATEPAPELL